ncbi:MAG: protease HtpX [Elusimicrobiales bacterium]|jgi:heat shock protein HtpX|nr:protease HtpX [Elusimicrobiales bacterium]NLH38774.1 protease HtpX [Elusimicrobiota bacterium]
MRIAKRVLLFIAVNILVVLTLSITLNILGVGSYLTAYGIDYKALIYFCLIWGMGGSFISLAMSKMMAKWFMGVKVISPDTSDSTLRWLVDTVYRISRDAGMNKMPEVGIYMSREVNAFATGATKNRALVAVSAGLLETMDRDEIEGVLGHEISHIVNGDMVTMALLQGVINAIVMFLARIITFAITSRRDENTSPWARILIINIFEIILSFFGMIVLAWFSRIREFSADEGGARLAGKDKMIAALRKLQRTVSRAEMTNAQSFKAFKISSKPSSIMNLFSTHPPLEKRIRHLEEMF